MPTTTTTDAGVRAAAAAVTGSRRMHRLFGAAAVAAFLGWLDTGVLTGIHYSVLPLPEGAAVAGTGWAVLTSGWSYLLGIPTAVYGALYYLVAFALVMLWRLGRMPQVERLFLPFSVIGISSSAIFVYLQLFVIEAICPFCMVSAATTTALFLIGIGIYRESKVPALRELGTAGIDRSTLAWAAVAMAPAIALLAMLQLVRVLPLPIPGS